MYIGQSFFFPFLSLENSSPLWLLSELILSSQFLSVNQTNSLLLPHRKFLAFPVSLIVLVNCWSLQIIFFSRRNVICHNRAVLWKLTQTNKGKKLVTWSYKCKKDYSPYSNSVQFTSAEICLWILSGMCWTSTIAELWVLYHTKQLPACLSICLFDMIDSLENFSLRAICFHNFYV